MIHLKINGEKREFPSSWDDITFEQYLKLINCKTDGTADVRLVSADEFIKGIK